MQLLARGPALTIVYKKLISPNKKAFFLRNCDIMRNKLQTLNIDLIIPMYN